MVNDVIVLDDRERVRITLGPWPSQDVLSWCSYARMALNSIAVQDHPFELPRDIELQIRDCVQTMMDVAAASDVVFEWETSVDLERLKLLLQYWFNIASALDEQATRRGWSAMSSSSQTFYEHLVGKLTGALPAGTYADRLRTTWPGVALAV